MGKWAGGSLGKAHSYTFHFPTSEPLRFSTDIPPQSKLP